MILLTLSVTDVITYADFDSVSYFLFIFLEKVTVIRCMVCAFAIGEIQFPSLRNWAFWGVLGSKTFV